MERHLAAVGILSIAEAKNAALLVVKRVFSTKDLDKITSQACAEALISGSRRKYEVRLCMRIITTHLIPSIP